MYIYNIDPTHASEWSPKFLKENLTIVAQTVQTQLGPLDANLECNIKKLSTVQDARYNIFKNVIENVCTQAYSD